MYFSSLSVQTRRHRRDTLENFLNPGMQSLANLLLVQAYGTAFRFLLLLSNICKLKHDPSNRCLCCCSYRLFGHGEKKKTINLEGGTTTVLRFHTTETVLSCVFQECLYHVIASLFRMYENVIISLSSTIRRHIL
jgi:hypothetical protein